jgi:predicted RNase H-like HicB family nuclease
MKVKAVIWQEDGVWCGSVPVLPGCHTWGESREQLLEMLKDAVQGWLEAAGREEEIVHGDRDLPNGTLKAILKDARLTERDLE